MNDLNSDKKFLSIALFLRIYQPNLFARHLLKHELNDTKHLIF